MRGCSTSKLGTPRSFEGDDLAVEHDLGLPERLAERAELREARGRVVAGARGERDASAVDDEQRAHAVPLHLERPVLVVGRDRRRRHREHRAEVVGALA